MFETPVQNKNSLIQHLSFLLLSSLPPPPLFFPPFYSVRFLKKFLSGQGYIFSIVLQALKWFGEVHWVKPFKLLFFRMGEEKCIPFQENPINHDRLIGYRINSPLSPSSFCWWETLLVFSDLQNCAVFWEPRLLAHFADFTLWFEAPVCDSSEVGLFLYDQGSVLITAFPFLGWEPTKLTSTPHSLALWTRPLNSYIFKKGIFWNLQLIIDFFILKYLQL